MQKHSDIRLLVWQWHWQTENEDFRFAFKLNPIVCFCSLTFSLWNERTDILVFHDFPIIFDFVLSLFSLAKMNLYSVYLLQIFVGLNVQAKDLQRKRNDKKILVFASLLEYSQIFLSFHCLWTRFLFLMIGQTIYIIVRLFSPGSITMQKMLIKKICSTYECKILRYEKLAHCQVFYILISSFLKWHTLSYSKQSCKQHFAIVKSIDDFSLVFWKFYFKLP